MTDAPSDGAESTVTFNIHVKPRALSGEMLVANLQHAGLSVAAAAVNSPPGFTGTASCVGVEGDSMTILEYETAAPVER